MTLPPKQVVPAVSVKGLCVLIGGREILRDIDLELPPGEFLGIVGPNGGGKTTLLKAMLGLVKPTAGTVSIFGRAPRDLMREGGFGYLPQHSPTDPRFPARAIDVVLMGLYRGFAPFSRFTREDRNRALSALDRLGAGHLGEEPYGTLSGGQRQRVNMARALVAEPRILLLDEPSTGIDVVGQEDFYHLLQGLKRKLDLSIIMVSHDIGAVTAYVDRVACLNRTLHFHGSPFAVLDEHVIQELYGRSIDLLRHSPACEACERLRH